MNISLLKLDLSHNAIDDFDGTVIASAIEHNHTLRDLNLSHNMMKKRTCERLREVLETNEVISMIDLSHNPFDETCGDILYDTVLSHNTTIVSFGDLNTNLLMGVRTVQEITYCLKENNLSKEVKRANIMRNEMELDENETRKFRSEPDYKILKPLEESNNWMED